MGSTLRSMETKRPGTGTEEDRDRDSWTNETLPLGMRRELLDRELQKLIARKRHGTASSGSVADAGRAHGGATGHPQADAPAGDDRAS